MRFQSQLKVTRSKEAALLFQEMECEHNQGGAELPTDPAAAGQLGLLHPSLGPFSAS